MKITMSVLDSAQAYRDRIVQTRMAWSGELFAPIAPVKLPADATGDEQDEIIESVGATALNADMLGPDGDDPDVRGPFGMDDTVLEATSLEICLDYPMTNPAHLQIEDIPDGKITPRLILGIVRDAYADIYRIEEQGETVPAETRLATGEILMNRPATNGMFGIWGHTIHVLAVEEIKVGDAGDGHAMAMITIGS